VHSGGYSAQRRIWISISSAAEDMDFHILRCALYPPLRTGAGSRPGEGGQEQVESRQAEEPDTASAGQVRVRTEQEQGGSQGAAAGQQGEGGGEGTELPESGDTGAAGGRGHGAAGGRGHRAAGGRGHGAAGGQGHGAAGGGDTSCTRSRARSCRTWRRALPPPAGTSPKMDGLFNYCWN
jgi:hypothetical protein